MTNHNSSLFQLNPLYPHLTDTLRPASHPHLLHECVHVYVCPLLPNLSPSGKAITAHILLPITTEVISGERDGPPLNLLIIVTTSI